MAETFTLEAEGRTLTGKKVSQLRAQGLVPAIIYGSHIDPVAIQVPYRPLEVTLMKAGGTHLIEVAVDGDRHAVLAREVQRDVLRRDILHVDFFAVNMDETIRATVPVQTTGESPAVENHTGILFHAMNSIEIEALPSDLIEAVVVDISGLAEVNDSITVGDLDMGDKVTLHASPDELVFRINPMPVMTAEEGEEAEEVEEEETGAEPEVIRREREEEDEE